MEIKSSCLSVKVVARSSDALVFQQLVRRGNKVGLRIQNHTKILRPNDF